MNELPARAGSCRPREEEATAERLVRETKVTIAAALLLLSGTWASGSACQNVQSPESIAGTLLRIGVGLLAEKTGEGLADVFLSAAKTRLGVDRGRTQASPKLVIDGQPAIGISGALRAAKRIVFYVADLRHDGSIGLSGQRTIRGLSVRWRSEVCDGRLTFTADVSGQMGEYLKHVQFRLWAMEDVRGGTAITGTAAGHAFYGPCLGKRIFARRAPGEIQAGMRTEVLDRVRTIGVDLFRGGDAELMKLVDGLRDGIRNR